MAAGYDHLTIEPKWQDAWDQAHAFDTPEITEGDPKAYILDFFPYPSGSGLHVGHLLGYTGTDIMARAARMQGKKVLHPMGWDAFGLPAENFAIKSGVHPSVSTAKNIAEFKRQFRQVGISYDWSKEINASDPSYYKWTQWLFTVLYDRGLAYRKEGLVNWCPSCQTVLANEQVVGGACERCGTSVIQKMLKQWYLKITDYAERLLNDLDKLDWPEKIKTMQRNWIGKSTGARLFFKVQNSEDLIEVFTTRPDTVFGATYMVIAPEHPLVPLLTTDGQKPEVVAYTEQAAAKTELERTFLGKEKTGVFTGSYAINPATSEPIPIWIADYVVSTYGTGAIMAVPAHDERDHAFATKFGLPIVKVIECPDDTLPYSEKGVLTNSAQFSGLESESVLGDLLQAIGGEVTTTYRLRDWLVSRQRFWGAPIPVAYDQDGGEHILPLESLPVELPMDVEFLPTGQSPLNFATAWKKYIDPKSGETWQREVDTLDTFVCSSWYYLRYPSAGLETAAFDRDEVKKWLPVDLYVGGAEHAVLHLLYARFFTKVLFDAGYLDFDEPFTTLRNQGMILGPDHNKMSKSKGNVINPDDVIREFGADTVRLYEMFMGPFDQEKPWSTQGILGVRRFLEKIWRLQEKVAPSPAAPDELRSINQAIARVTHDIAEFKFNTAVAGMMEAVNQLSSLATLTRETLLDLVRILCPFAPHIAEEIWSLQGGQGFASSASWPAYDSSYLVEESVEYPIQVNGKVKAKISASPNTSREEVLAIAKDNERIRELIDGKNIVKEIVIPGRLVSLVTE